MQTWQAAALGLGVAVPATWLALRAAPALGLVDAPAPHKSHARLTPRSGGLGLAAALLVVTLTGTLGAEARAVLLPAVGFLLLGLADDRWRLSARTKLGAQVALAGLAVALGLRWVGAGVGPFPNLEFGSWTALLTLLWVVAVVTVTNFLDGIDLLTLTWTSVYLAFAAGAGVGPGEGRLFAAAAGAALGVACWNVTPARVFPGDGATHLLGFLIAAAALAPREALPSAALPWPLAGAMLLPGIVDVGTGLATKLRRGIRLSAAHRDHPYQRLTRLGHSHGAVALRYGALTLLAAGVAQRLAPEVGLLAALLLGAVVLGLHLAQAARAPRAPASFFVGGEPRAGDDAPMLTNFGWVLPGQLAGMGRPGPEDWAELSSRGVRSVLSLTETAPPGDPPRHGLHALHVPIEDFGTPSDADLERCTQWVQQQLAAARPVVVHCFAGVGRTGTVLAAVLVERGLSAEAAIEAVRRARPGSLETAGQVAAVQRLAHRRGRP